MPHINPSYCAGQSCEDAGFICDCNCTSWSDTGVYDSDTLGAVDYCYDGQSDMTSSYPNYFCEHFDWGLGNCIDGQNPNQYSENIYVGESKKYFIKILDLYLKSYIVMLECLDIKQQKLKITAKII